MDIIKRNMFSVILGAFVVVGTGVMIFLIVSSLTEFKQKRTRVEEITKLENQFKSRPYKLDKSSYDIAEANKGKIQVALNDLQTGLRDRYTTIDFSNHQMTAVKFKENLQNRSEVMHQVLRISNVTVPASLNYFGFDHFLKPQVIPVHEQIAAVIKQLQIYDEMVEILSRSDVKKVDTWVFKGQVNNPEPEVREVNNESLYQFFSYEMSVTASVPALQKFLVNLNQSSYCFIVRWMSVGSSMNSITTIAGAVGSGASMGAVRPGGGNVTAPGSGEEQPVEAPTPTTGSSKGQRVIFTSFAPVHMNLAIDYIEFLD